MFLVLIGHSTWVTYPAFGCDGVYRFLFTYKKLEACVSKCLSLAPFLSTIFVDIFAYRCYSTGLTSKVTDMCGGACSKRIHSNNGDASSGPGMSACRNSMDRVRAAKVPTTDLDYIPLPFWKVTDANDNSRVGVHLSCYTRVGYRCFAPV